MLMFDNLSAAQAAADEEQALTLPQSVALFDFLAAQTSISYDYLIEGCWTRAHVMAKIANLDQLWIFPKNSFDMQTGILNVAGIEERLSVDDLDSGQKMRHVFHVACVGDVILDDQIIPVIYDPSLFDGPVTQAEWIETMGAQNAQCIRTGANKVIDIDNIAVPLPDDDSEYGNNNLRLGFSAAIDMTEKPMVVLNRKKQSYTPDLVKICTTRNGARDAQIQTLALRPAQNQDFDAYNTLMQNFLKWSPDRYFIRASSLRSYHELLSPGDERIVRCRAFSARDVTTPHEIVPEIFT